MAKINWEKDKETKKIRDQGWEPANGEGRRGDARVVKDDKFATKSAEEVRAQSRTRKQSLTASELRRLELSRRFYERKRGAPVSLSPPSKVSKVAKTTKKPRTSKASKVAKTTKRPRTDYEIAYLGWLGDCANAEVNKRPFPPVPIIIEQRYNGPKLNSWRKNALQTARYKTALARAKESRKT
jgi:hypothetical protein